MYSSKTHARKCRTDIPFYTEKNDIEASEEIYYILGLIAADGCLGDGGKLIQLELSSEDAYVLKWISKTLINEQFNFKEYAPRTSNHKPTTRFRANLPKLYHMAMCIGITPRKSKTLSVVWSKIPRNYQLHFLRGVIDAAVPIYNS